jgi:hypothetical protein
MWSFVAEISQMILFIRLYPNNLGAQNVAVRTIIQLVHHIFNFLSSCTPKTQFSYSFCILWIKYVYHVLEVAFIFVALRRSEQFDSSWWGC